MSNTDRQSSFTRHASSRRIPVGLVTHHFWRDVSALVFLALLTIAFFWPVLFTGKWLPHGGGDLVSFLWPQYSFAAQTIREGAIPLWNPFLYSGAPLLADNQSGVLYPINLLAFVLFPHLSYQVMEGLVIFHIWLAGVAMYVALRIWPLGPSSTLTPSLSLLGRGGVGRLPTILGAVAYMFNDVMITHIGNLNLIAVAAWLPLVLALLARGLSERRAGLSILAGVTFAVASLAGHAQMTVIILVGMLALMAWQIIIATDWRARGRVLGLTALALLVAFGLTAAQLLPALETTGYSLRAGLSYEEATAYSLPPAALAATFSPLLFGRGATEFWGPWDRVETAYLGIVPLILAGFAFMRKRSSGVWALLALGVLGLLIALGKFTPVYSLVHSLPVLAGLRIPARFILLTNFSIAALAAIGLQRLMTEQFSLQRVIGWSGVVAVVGVLALWLAYRSAGSADRINNFYAALSFLLWVGVTTLILALRIKSTIGSQLSAILLIGLLTIELIVPGSTLEIDAADPTQGYSHPAVVEFLHSDPGVFRIENTSDAWQPDAAWMHRLNDIGGIFNPLGLANYATYTGGMGNRGSPLYNFLGVKYVVANKGQPPGDASFVPVFNVDPQIDVYLNTKGLPRAQLIDQAKIVPSGEAAWQAIHAPEFDPTQEVVVEGGEQLSGVPDRPAARMLSFVSLSNERVELIARTESPEYLVLSDVYYPGWTATIDGQPAKLYPANFAFRAVLVPPGEHRVTFAYEPVTWRVGIGLTGVTLLLLAAWYWRRRRGWRA